MLQTPIAWLRRVPIHDPVDRRNAPMLQIVLLILGTLPPLLWLYRIFGLAVPWRPGETTALVTSLLISAVAFFCFVLIRRGRFQWAVRQMLVVVAIMLVVAYAASGVREQTYEQPLHVMWMFVAGMMVGRRALWGMYGVLLVALVAGMVADAQPPRGTGEYYFGDPVARGIMFLLIAIVIDRSVAAMRSSLDEATRRGRELALANERLKQEVAVREQAQMQLIHSQKVEAIGRMASGIAHDFNHLLGLVLGYTERSRRIEMPGEARELFDRIESAAGRASAITGRLLHFSRREDEYQEVFDARDGLRELQPMLRQTVGQGIALDVELPSAPCPIRFDRARFGLALLNVAANAADAMPDGGRLRVRLRAPAGDVVGIELADDGHGMERDLLPRIIEPFFTTKPAGHGTGLGLAIVSSVVDAARGSVQIDSRPGFGTTVRIDLPLAADVDDAYPHAAAGDPSEEDGIARAAEAGRSTHYQAST